MPRAFLLAGTRSGCGKTSVCLGLLRALARRGLAVQPFKAGPDFIDPGLHAAAAGRVSHNLDTWMMPERAVRACFARYAADADVVVVEGAMGLFDGRGGASEEGSAAHLAKLLGLPVLLVVDASARARSLAAEALGFARFDPDLRPVGAILNRVGSPRHERMLREAMALVPELPLFGCLRRDDAIVLGSRHLGLVTAEDAAELGARLDALADWVESGLDVAAFLAAPPQIAGLVPRADAEASRSRNSRGARDRAAKNEFSAMPGLAAASIIARKRLRGCGENGDAAAERVPTAAPEPTASILKVLKVPKGPKGPKIGVARDRAFCFVYAENLRLLAETGAEIVFFSPLADAALPAGLGGLYLPGGYPELAAAELARNAAMRAAVRDFCAAGRPVWAECGGYMYLLEALVDRSGAVWPMCGALPGRARMAERRAALGYREARTCVDGPLGPAGTVLRGHEFHYSEPEGTLGPPAFALTASDGATTPDGQARGRVVGGYFHAHLASDPDVAAHFVAACRREREDAG